MNCYFSVKHMERDTYILRAEYANAGWVLNKKKSPVVKDQSEVK